MPAMAADAGADGGLDQLARDGLHLGDVGAAEHLQGDADVDAALAEGHALAGVAGDGLGVGGAFGHRRQVGQAVDHHQVDVLRAAVVGDDVDDALVPAEGGQVVVVLAHDLVEAVARQAGQRGGRGGAQLAVLAVEDAVEVHVAGDGEIDVADVAQRRRGRRAALHAEAPVERLLHVVEAGAQLAAGDRPHARHHAGLRRFRQHRLLRRNQPLDLRHVQALRLLAGDLADEDLRRFRQAGLLQRRLQLQAVARDLQLLQLRQHLAAQVLKLRQHLVGHRRAVRCDGVPASDGGGGGRLYPALPSCSPCKTSTLTTTLIRHVCPPTQAR